jgi:diaminopimelate epimerase
MFPYTSDFGFLHASAPALQPSDLPAQALRVKSLFPAGKAKGVRLFWANACRNHFLIVLGSPQDVAATYAQVLPRVDAWTFDSVLGVSPEVDGGVRMRVLESDGSESTMCGNGARAVGRLLDQLGLPMRVLVGDGSVLAMSRTSDGLYSVPMGPVVRRGDFFTPPPAGWPRFHLYVVCGEPHAVVFVPSVQDVPLDTWGGATVPRANCTVVARTSGRHVTARTFERGVNRETYSCGTGATAAAQLALDLAADQPGREGEAVVHVRMKGGPLRVRAVAGQGSFLEGPAEVWEVM